MLYGSEHWVVKKHVQKCAAQMKILKWICGHSKKD
uniref:Uncharacterized protein n=1 Tax=Rhizophora mucronata TaxID=61149 RepID=A0A2P2P3X7_RHIMU